MTSTGQGAEKALARSQIDSVGVWTLADRPARQCELPFPPAPPPLTCHAYSPERLCHEVHPQQCVQLTALNFY
jgi:hypothetical protein